MARPVAAQGLFSLGTSITLVKLVKKLMEGGTVEEWWNVSPQAQQSSTYIVDYPIITTEPRNIHNQKLTWPQVLRFFIEQVEEMDLQLACFVLFLCLLGPLIWSLLDTKSSSAAGNSLLHNVSTQTEQEPEEKVTERHFHYDPAERALLQFGRSKSESVLSVFKYSPIQFDYNEPEEEVDEIVAGCTIKTEPIQKTPLEILEEKRRSGVVKPFAPIDQEVILRLDTALSSQKQFKDSSQLCPKVEHQVLVQNSSGNISPGNREAPSVKSAGSLPSFRGAPLERASSAQSLSFLQIQISPRKTSHVEVQVNPEQAYSQPFTY
ncbi:Nvj1p TDEL_0D00550 [Torulaspora delbrueckii]|uniref:Uncharacterized protein n=1 Tax=Torulaspora delbrueckii TaxID=4950 RepID=G8ZSP5_TORDE|nr:hypothetical protein TDEL_0D00550 [Torulaspora delbrueckii]CCE91639.1 hypothetical protein TDEL_0D00550 [Torulaspora delbrueckii]